MHAPLPVAAVLAVVLSLLACGRLGYETAASDSGGDQDGGAPGIDASDTPPRDDGGAVDGGAVDGGSVGTPPGPISDLSLAWHQDVVSVGSVAGVQETHIASTGSGGLYFGGLHTGELRLADAVLPAPPSREALPFLASIDGRTGAVRWLERQEGRPTGWSADRGGNWYMSSLVQPGRIFASSHQPDGTVRWMIGGSYIHGHDIVASEDGHAYVFGTYSFTARVGTDLGFDVAGDGVDTGAPTVS